jgi:hypothetical protein
MSLSMYRTRPIPNERPHDQFKLLSFLPVLINPDCCEVSHIVHPMHSFGLNFR